jgi:hypothetical protein
MSDNKEKTIFDNIIELVIIPIFSFQKMIDDFTKNIGLVKSEQEAIEKNTTPIVDQTTKKQ